MDFLFDPEHSAALVVNVEQDADPAKIKLMLQALLSRITSLAGSASCSTKLCNAACQAVRCRGLLPRAQENSLSRIFSSAGSASCSAKRGILLIQHRASHVLLDRKKHYAK
jgi:hypothetical protein